MAFRRVHIATTLLAIVAGSIIVATSAAQPISSKTSVRLLDELKPGLGSEERSARLDMFFSELGFYQEPQKDTASVGYVLVYCGKVCRYGEVEAHVRGIILKSHTRRVPRNRLKIVAAGYREEATVELWVASNDQVAPVPKPTIDIKHVNFTRATKRIVEAYDCCDDPNEVWEYYIKNKRIN